MFLDRPWDVQTLRRLVFGVTVPDSGSGCGYADVPGVSVYQMCCRALDTGSPELMLDAIQFEGRLAGIEDLQERAAVTLAACGWDVWAVGAALRSNRTGEALVRGGLRDLVRGGRGVGSG